MRVLVLGAYGLIGSAIVDRLLAAGHQVVGLGRAIEAASIRYPDVEWISRDLRRLVTPEDWTPLLAGVAAIINAAGVLQDGPQDDVVAVQSTAMRALFRSCETLNIRRVVQISAAGAGAKARTLFMTSKAEADAALATTNLDWIILRPGLVIGPHAYGATALVRALASFPFVLPVALPHTTIQTVHVEDVAGAAVDAIEGRVPGKAAYDLVETHPRTFEDVLVAFRTRFGLRSDRRVVVPRALVRILFRFGDAVGHLGWRSPLRSTALRQVEASIAGDPTAWRGVSRRELSPLNETLRRIPASVQERWFARMWLLKPVIIGTLALFWIVSGVVALVQFDAARIVLTSHGFSASSASVSVLLGGAVDVVIGLGLLIRKAMPVAALSGIIAALGYLIAGTLWTPDLWLDPLGSFTKDIPLMALLVTALAIASDR
jgi:uncharacterized protein YbjT (DUF2867 family)